MARILGGSRYLVLLSVVGSLLGSAVVTLYAGVELVRIERELVPLAPQQGDLGKRVAAGATELIELFLLVQKGAIFHGSCTAEQAKA